jgi:hypothetical protein
MTHFEAYQWEDHVPRAGSWKFNLAAGLVALGLIYAALPHASGDAPAMATAAAPTSGTRDLKMNVSAGPASSLQPAKGWSTFCPTAAKDYADS